MTILQSLAPTGRRLVTPELASGELERHPPEAWLDHVQPCSHVLELDALDVVVAELLAQPLTDPSAFDAKAACAIHRALPLTRRAAADSGVWRFLAVVHAPGLVRHRWRNESWTTMRDRFWKAGMRLSRRDCRSRSV